MNLILAEKFSQANEYLSVLGRYEKKDGYYIISPNSFFPKGAYLTWGVGHLVTLKEPSDYREEWANWSLDQLPLIPEKFEFKVAEGKEKQFNTIKELLKNSEIVIIATDTDREGENIARSILHLAGYSHLPTKRLWFNSLEDDELKRAFRDLKNGDDYYSLYQEAQARQIGDWLVGLNASRLYTTLIQKHGLKDVFSVGRVQTPTLCLINQRQTEIEEFKSKPFYEIHSKIKVKTGEFVVKTNKKFESKEELFSFLQDHNLNHNEEQQAIIKSVIKKEKNELAPKLFSLSTLQSYLNKKYKYSPTKSLNIIQSLYDSPMKLITYPRTDTEYITEHEFAYIKKNLYSYQVISNNVFEPETMQENSRYVDSTKVQEHYAIIPTKKIPTKKVLNSMSVEQKNVYFEILNRTLGMFHKPYTFEETEITVLINNLELKCTGKVEIEKGWKSLYKDDQKSEKQKESVLPQVFKGMKGKGQIVIHEGKTSPPKRYTEGQLIDLMKTCGKFETDSDNQSILKEIQGLGTEATRANIIETLKKQQYIAVKNNLVYVTEKGKLLTQLVQNTLLSKPELTAKWEAYLRKIGNREGSKDTFIKNIILFVKKLVDDVTSNFDHSIIEKTNQKLEEQQHIARCPKCKKGYVIEKEGFYGCTEYKNGCQFTLSKKILNKTLTKKQVQDLVTKGKTAKIKGFEGKKKFDSYLILEDFKIKFSFE